MIYFDTSVLAAYYTIESQTSVAKELVGRATDPAISDIGVAELNVVIARKAKEGFLSPEAADAVFGVFEEHLRDVFHRVSLGSEQVAAVRKLAQESSVPLRTLDALHLVFAVELNATVATFDGRLAAAASALGVEVLP